LTIAQKESFVRNWFKDKPASADKCWEKLEKDYAIKELANVPLLLTLLCIAFEENLDFPPNRAILYEHAINALLRTSRQIERAEVYKNLTLPLKQNLLGQMAYYTFVEDHYIVEERQFCDIIANFVNNAVF
jgi:predicted NACHT family NTPase